ncbi:MAG: phosphorylase family protein, partial [Bdellovibrionota bacterium]
SSSIYLKIKKRNLRTYGGSLVGSAVEHLSAASKADLFAQTKAVGVDMESQEAAAFAAEHGLPFAVLRTISDPANFDLPAAIREAINPDGSINYQAVISAIFRDPSQIGPLLQSAFYSMTAFRHLRRARDAVHLGTL